MITGQYADANERRRLMREMIHRLDVDLLELAYDELGATYERAHETCSACATATACKAWLAGDSAAGPDFCPNLSAFSRFRKA